MSPLRGLFESLVSPLDHLSPFWGLTLFSAISGVAMLWVFGKTTSPRGLERAREQMVSAVYEIRLYLNNPRRVFSAQGRLLGWNAVYVGYMLPAFIVMGLPLSLFYLHLDARYGIAPVGVGQPIVATIELASGTDASRVTVAQGLKGVKVTAPAVFDAKARRKHFRVFVTVNGTHTLRFRSADERIDKIITADPGARKVSPHRAAGLGALWSPGIEGALPASSGIKSISIPHPLRQQSWAGLPMPWWIYWIIVSMIVAVVLRKRMGVAF